PPTPAAPPRKKPRPPATDPPTPSPSPTGAPPASPVPTTAPVVNPYSAVSTRQYQLPNGDGETWTGFYPSRLSLTFKPALKSAAIISGNADLWTNRTGVNQDIGIF